MVERISLSERLYRPGGIHLVWHMAGFLRQWSAMPLLVPMPRSITCGHDVLARSPRRPGGRGRAVGRADLREPLGIAERRGLLAYLTRGGVGIDLPPSSSANARPTGSPAWNGPPYPPLGANDPATLALGFSQLSDTPGAGRAGTIGEDGIRRTIVIRMVTKIP